MAYWWVNHKQTFTKEFVGGYIWSPKVNKNKSRNQSYVNLTLASVGDVVFSYADTFIKAVGIVEEKYVEAPVPEEFGNIGAQWNNDGYLIKINWTPLVHSFKPKNHIGLIRNLLPEKYSPLQQTGDGNQSIYLAKISNELAALLLSLIGEENPATSIIIDEMEENVQEDNEEKAIQNANIPETEKQQLIKARIGQGIFKSRLIKVEKACRLTGVNNPVFLIASHIKPWAESNNEEKLDGNNGLLLSPHVDKLFDRGWISFSDSGDVLIKDSARQVINDWGLKPKNVGSFNKKQRAYLAYHRERFKLS